MKKALSQERQKKTKDKNKEKDLQLKHIPSPFLLIQSAYPSIALCSYSMFPSVCISTQSPSAPWIYIRCRPGIGLQVNLLSGLPIRITASLHVQHQQCQRLFFLHLYSVTCVLSSKLANLAYQKCWEHMCGALYWVCKVFRLYWLIYV